MPAQAPQEPQALNFESIPKATPGTAPATPDALDFGSIPKQAPTPAPTPAAGRGSPGYDPRRSVEGTRSILTGMDPRTPEGRSTLATTAVGLGTAYLTGGGSTLPWITRILLPGVTTASAAGAMEAGEQLAGTKPVSKEAVVTQAALQPAYEYGSRALFWPVKRVGALLASGRVARAAGRGLRDAVETAKTTATELVDQIREQGRTYVEGVRRAGRGRIRATQAATAAERADLEAVQAADLADLERIYSGLESAPPGILADTRAVTSVVARGGRTSARGPAQRALDMAGEEVGKAAQSGPPIAVTPLKDALDEMIRAARPPDVFRTAKQREGIGFLQSLGARQPAVAAGAPSMIPESRRVQFAQAFAKELNIADAGHPLPGILGKLAAMPEGSTLSFADAHAVKRLLDEAVRWDDVSKKHLGQITKALRTQLRESMSVHEPYNAATAAYEQSVDLFRRGAGAKLIKAAETDPDAVVRMLSPQRPQQAARLKELIVEQAARGGDPAAGWRAWQAMQSAFTYEHVIKGGLSGLSQRVGKILAQSPEFARTVYGDEAGARVLSNLDALGQAARRAEIGFTRPGMPDVRAVTEAGRTATRRTRDEAADQLRQARTDAGATTRATQRTGAANIQAAEGDVRRFRESRTGRVEKQEDPSVDALYMSALGPQTYVGARAVMRILQSPNADELLQWIGYSDRLTQLTVRALASQLPAAATAGLIRDLHELQAPSQPTDPAAPFREPRQAPQ